MISKIKTFKPQARVLGHQCACTLTVNFKVCYTSKILNHFKSCQTITSWVYNDEFFY